MVAAVITSGRLVAADWMEEYHPGEDECIECLRRGESPWRGYRVCHGCVGLMHDLKAGKLARALSDSYRGSVGARFRISWERTAADYDAGTDEPERGWYGAGGWYWEADDKEAAEWHSLVDPDDLKYVDHHDDPCVVAAIALLREYGCVYPLSDLATSDSRWDSELEQDIRTGERVRLTVHFSGIDREQCGEIMAALK